MSSPQYFEVGPDQLTVQHIGLRAYVKYDNELRYDIGTIVAISSDAVGIRVKLADVPEPVIFLRKPSRRGRRNPHLYVWRR